MADLEHKCQTCPPQALDDQVLSLGLAVSFEMSLGLSLSALSSHWLTPAVFPALQAMFRVGELAGSFPPLPLLSTVLKGPQ